MMPSAVTHSDGGDRVRAAMLAYSGYGFSVIPILPGTKKPYGVILPEGQWRRYQQQTATEAEINRWVDERPDTGVGIVCGVVSGGVYCLDVDDFEFAVWLEGYAPLKESGAWVVRTGSGKMHIWVRSQEKVITTVMIGGGHKLADVRGDGHEGSGPSYIIAPPTLHPLTGQAYETLYGSPEFIVQVRDGRRTFDGLRDRYLSGVPDAPRPEVSEDSSGPQRILKLNEEESARIEDKIRTTPGLSRRTRKSLLQGAEAGEPMWHNAPSNSEVDHNVIAELIRAGWNGLEVEEAFAWSPLGEHRYRAKNSGNSYGHRYIFSSLANLQRDELEAARAASEAAGANFKIDRVIRLGFEEPLYEIYITVTAPSEHQGRITLAVEDLMDEHRFKRACMKGMNFLPAIDSTLLGHKFEKFGARLLAMAVEESVPERATTGGHLKATIRAFIEEEASVEEPEDHRMVTLGWRLNGSVYIRGGALLQRLQTVIYPRPKPEEAWTVLRALGGQETGHTWPATGKRETVWMLPTRRVQVE